MNDHILYRCYDASGLLLYIGITKDTGNRFAVHACSTPWWPHVAAIETDEDFSTRDELEGAERAAILAEIPLHNREHNDNWHTKFERVLPVQQRPDLTGLTSLEIFDKFFPQPEAAS